jgi:phthiocerol/phenolphthiocerol synthesis type-I polyketide synthase C
MPAGTRPFTAQQGLAAWQMLHGQDAIATGVMPVDLIEWQRHHPSAARSSLFANLRLTEGSAADSPAAKEDKNATDSIRAALAAAEPLARRALAEEYLRDRISRVLRMPPEKLDARQSLNNLGIDSLMAVELRNHVQAHLGVTIPLAKLLQDPTIAQLAQTVLDQIDAAPQPSAAEPTAAGTTAAPPTPVSTQQSEPSDASAQEALAQLQDLTDEEVDALLRQMLSEEEQQA